MTTKNKKPPKINKSPRTRENIPVPRDRQIFFSWHFAVQIISDLEIHLKVTCSGYYTHYGKVYIPHLGSKFVSQKQSEIKAILQANYGHVL